MLHVLNGDATLVLLRQSGLAGKSIVWKDMLMEGPVTTPPGGASRADTALDWKARAAFLHAQYGIDAGKYRTGMRAFFRALDKAAHGKEEVVFWFEEDFFCQIHLVYLLAHLPATLKRKGRASVICPDKPLGIRLPEAMGRLLEGRLPLEPKLLTLSRTVWKAYAASTPKGWDTLLNWARSGKGFDAWPMLRTGLRAHLGRLPAADGGLNGLETALLRSASAGPSDFAHFARRVWSETLVKPLGLGDLQIARYVLDLARKDPPLLAITGADSSPKPGKLLRPTAWKIRLAPAGKALLAKPA